MILRNVMLNKLFSTEITRISNIIKEEEKRLSIENLKEDNENLLMYRSYRKILYYLKREKPTQNDFATYIKDVHNGEGAKAQLFCFLEKSITDGLKKYKKNFELNIINSYILYLKEILSEAL